MFPRQRTLTAIHITYGESRSRARAWLCIDTLLINWCADPESGRYDYCLWTGLPTQTLPSGVIALSLSDVN